jgi:DNA-binding MarR family transcriptional regulator
MPLPGRCGSGLIRGLSSPPLRVISAASDAQPLGEALAFMQVLWAVAHGLESNSKRMHAELGITGPQRLVLRLIGHHGRMSAGALAEVLHIHPSSLTGMLRRLEQADLIRRESDPFDRRRALLKLTRRGMRLNDEQAGTIEAKIAQALSRMSRERVSTTKAVLAEIASALGAETDLQEASVAASPAPAKASSSAAARRKPPKKKA